MIGETDWTGTNYPYVLYPIRYSYERIKEDIEKLRHTSKYIPFFHKFYQTRSNKDNFHSIPNKSYQKNLRPKSTKSHYKFYR